MKRILSALLIVIATGCASVDRIDPGERALGERMSLKLTGAWNHLNVPGLGPAQVWTMEGLTVDQLLLYSGIREGQAISAGTGTDGKRVNLAFRSTMQPHEIVELFERMLTRDGSRFDLVKLEPAPFGGSKGFRFEYALTRRADNVQLSGVGFGTVSRGELFAMLYMAPRLAFFAKHAPSVEQIAGTALVRE